MALEGTIYGDTNLPNLFSALMWEATPYPDDNRSWVEVSFWLYNNTGSNMTMDAAWDMSYNNGKDGPQSKHKGAKTNAPQQADWYWQWGATFWAYHDDSGNFTTEISVTGGTITGSYTSTSLTGTITLDPITQKCKFSSITDPVTFGEDVTIQISKPDANMGAVVTLAVGSRTATINYDSRTSYTWTLPVEWEDQLNGSNSILVTATLTTYSNSSHTTQLGTDSLYFTANKHDEPVTPPTPLPNHWYREADEIYTGIEATITVYNSSGTVVQTIDIQPEDIISYTVSGNLGNGVIPLGGTVAREFEFTFDNEEYNINYRTIENASVYVKSYSCDHYPPVAADYIDFGYWYISDISASDQSTHVTISGSDAMAIKLNNRFTDSGSYPKTIYGLLTSITSAHGITIDTTNFFNYNLEIETQPEWPDEITQRDVIGYIAMCAAGYARISNSGHLQIVTPNYTAPLHVVEPEYYTELTNRGGEGFRFNALEVSHDEESSRYVLDDTIEALPTNTIQIEWNPLLSEDVINTIMAKCYLLHSEGASLSWFGHPEVLPGDLLHIARTNPSERLSDAVLMIITDYTISFDGGGISCECNSDMPTKNSDGISGYSSSVQVFNPDGSINAKAIAGSVLDYRSGVVTTSDANTSYSVSFSSEMKGIPFVMVTQISGSYITNAKITERTTSGFKLRTSTSSQCKFLYLALYLAGVDDDAGS